MVRNMLGYLLAIAGSIGYIFFSNYQGSLFQQTGLITFCSVIAVLAGLFLIVSAKFKKGNQQEKFNRERLTHLKQHADIIQMTLQNCTVRENNYFEQVEKEGMPSRIEIADAVYAPNRNYKERFVIQSAIIFHYSKASQQIKMTSQSFPFSSEILKGYIENGKLHLYVDKTDAYNYAFEISA